MRAAVHGHARLDWVLLLDPVATEVMACWQALAHRVEAPQQGRSPIAIGQLLQSTGLAVQTDKSVSKYCQVYWAGWPDEPLRVRH
mgnify:CR=1 FL=1